MTSKWQETSKLIDFGDCDTCVAMMFTPEVKHDKIVDDCTNAGNEDQGSVDKCENQ